ncbi:MAG: hypothetical protein WCF36_14265 [Candidatus Nanopelagicales bacterium]
MVHIPAGNYASITIAGACDVEPGGVYSIVGNLNVLAGAVFDAQSAPSTITVGRNVTGAAGSLVGLGCQPNPPDGPSAHPCEANPTGSSTITVNGNVSITDASAALLNGITVKGNVTITGGGSPFIPWSIKNNTIDGNLTVSDLAVTWVGALFNTVGKNLSLTNITITDVAEEGGSLDVYVVRNTIGRNLNCSGLSGAASYGIIVARNSTGQCA